MDLTKTTIADFGEQWTHFRENEGYYSSQTLFADIVSPFLTEKDFEGKRVADIGSGTGRIVNMILAAGAAHVLAIEPSAAMAVCRENTKNDAERITYLEEPGEAISPNGDLDLVLSIGVLHHIPEPAPVVAAALRALRPGGKMLGWIYGREGNELYLSIAQPLRRLTKKLPHAALHSLARGLEPPLSAYGALSRWLPLPMREYMVEHINKLSRDVRVLTIYDQLNPAWARYYTRDEVVELFTSAGFVDVQVNHRHAYSWTVIGTRPPR